ncbi:MAG: V4R domain-containing protein [Gemmatimonadota bacterium]
MNGTEGRGRAGSVPAAAIGAVHRGVMAVCGETEAAQVLRQIGLEGASALHAGFAEWVASRSGDRRTLASLARTEFWNALSDYFVAIGLGPIEQEELHAGVLALSSTTWIESRATESRRPSCHLTTGLLAGLLREVAGEDLAALEVECRGSGEGQCRFLIGSAPALEKVHGEMLGGSGYRSAVSALA